MGKSTATAQFRRWKIPVHDADATVHRLLGPGGAAVAAVARAFPGTVAQGRVNRQALGAAVFGNPQALKRLEAILHPLVHQAERRFLKLNSRKPLVVLDIPLLLETGGGRRCDLVAVISAPATVQRQRVLARPGMTAEKFARILAAQMPDRIKRRHADHVISSGLGRAVMYRQLAALRRAGHHRRHA
jgi:dephospho-CoA kinase